MGLNKTTKNYLVFFILILLYIPLFKYYIFLNNNGGHSFMTADWLINYRFGYINMENIFLEST